MSFGQVFQPLHLNKEQLYINPEISQNVTQLLNTSYYEELCNLAKAINPNTFIQFDNFVAIVKIVTVQNCYVVYNIQFNELQIGYLLDQDQVLKYMNLQQQLLKLQMFNQYQLVQPISQHPYINNNQKILLVFKYKTPLQLTQLTVNQQYLFGNFVSQIQDLCEQSIKYNIDLKNCAFSFDNQLHKFQFQLQYCNIIENDQPSELMVQFAEQMQLNNNQVQFLSQSHLNNLYNFSVFMRQFHEYCNQNRIYNKVTEKVFSETQTQQFIQQLNERSINYKDSESFRRALEQQKYNYTLQYVLNFYRQLVSHSAEDYDLAKSIQAEEQSLIVLLEICDKLMESIFELYSDTEFDKQ